MDAVDLEKLKRWHDAVCSVKADAAILHDVSRPVSEGDLSYRVWNDLREIEREMRAAIMFEAARRPDEPAMQWAERRLAIAPCPTLAPHCDSKAP